MHTLIPLTCLALLGCAAGQVHAGGQDGAATPAAQEARPAEVQAQDDTIEPAPAPKGAAVPSVTVSGSRANDTEQRRNSTAAKMIFGREELDRNGDSNLGEILKRLPGVTVGGRPGRGGAVRMRGLGSGYTQILLNGERAPAGFSFESLSPDQVERIEVMRGPVAEHSTQAIAGTINIVLREGYQQKNLQLKLTDSIEQGRHAPNVALTVPGKAGQLSYLLSGSVFSNRQRDAGSTRTLDSFSAPGIDPMDQLIATTSARRSKGIHLTPRLSYRFNNGDSLVFQPFLMHNRSETSSDALLTQTGGRLPPEYASAAGDARATTTFVRAFGNWLHKMEGGAKLDVKFGFGAARGENDSQRRQYDAAGVQRNLLVDKDSTRDRGGSTGGKYTTPLGQGHLLAAGWDIEGRHRSETRVALDNGAPEFADSGDNLSADTRRLAAFVQDEWDITKQFSAYLGLRWEGIRTVSARVQGDVSNTSRVWSPVLHGVYRIPGHEKDQLRMSLTHSYRAPQVNDLIAVPTLARPNGPTRPDRVGNPDLKPELAKGIDIAYEHYIGKSGIVSASGFVRDIDDLMRRVTAEEGSGADARWVSRPRNIGHARTSGIELEAKFQLADLMADAPNIDLRSNYSHFWSSVDDVPGPNNRLDQQAKQTANLGLDYRLKAVPLTVGGSFNWTPEMEVRTSADETVGTGAKRQLDLYGLWKFSPIMQLRISANNLLGDDSESGRAFDTQRAFSSSHTYTTWGFQLEMKL